MSQTLQAFPTQQTLPEGSYTYAELMNLLHEQGFTGSVTLHFRSGTPAAVDFGRPLKVTLSTLKT